MSSVDINKFMYLSDRYMDWAQAPTLSVLCPNRILMGVYETISFTPISPRHKVKVDCERKFSFLIWMCHRTAIAFFSLLFLIPCLSRKLVATERDKLTLQDCLEPGREANVRNNWGAGYSGRVKTDYCF